MMMKTLVIRDDDDDDDDDGHKDDHANDYDNYNTSITTEETTIVTTNSADKTTSINFVAKTKSKVRLASCIVQTFECNRKSRFN